MRKKLQKVWNCSRDVMLVLLTAVGYATIAALIVLLFTEVYGRV